MTEAEEMIGEFKTLRYLGIEAIINMLLKSPRGVGETSSEPETTIIKT